MTPPASRATRSERGFPAPGRTAFLLALLGLACGGCGLKGPLRWEQQPLTGDAPPSESAGAGSPPAGDRPGRADGAARARVPAEPRAPAEATRTFGLDPAEEALLAAAAAQADCRPADAFEALALWLRTWPEHALAPEATLRLGEVYGDPDCPCHDPDAARAAWQRVLDAWPTTASAALARGYLDAPPDLPGPGP